MNFHQLFAALPPEIVEEVFGALREKERDAYRQAIETLANQRKLRPVFLEKKPREERHRWMAAALARQQNESLAANVIQLWLITARPTLLTGFLDALGIKHDGKGMVEQMPICPPEAELNAAVENLFAQYPPAVVATYLHAFEAMEPGHWPALGAMLSTDPRLKLA